ncbi:MAG: matrixin family metalloprotease [Actinomycetota bacterium]|nr:matrixin family metalloprotease [Actinomycetota bacterium]
MPNLLTTGSLVAIATVALLGPPLAARAESGAETATRSCNEYSVVGLPDVATEPASFTVAVDGTRDVARMTYGYESRTSGPWQFTFDPAHADIGYVAVAEGSGCTAQVAVATTVPFGFSRTIFGPGSSARTTAVANRTDRPATATVTRPDGMVAGSYALEPRSSTAVPLPGTTVRETTHYTVTVTADSGLAMSTPVVVTKGWSTLAGGDLHDAAVFDNCTTIPWHYSPQGARGDADTIERDIVRAQRLISTRTGLSFQHVDDPAQARIQYSWDTLGVGGPSAIGGFGGSSEGPLRGFVTFNSDDTWPSDAYAGIGARHGAPADRGWMIVHETMHTMGLGHSTNQFAVMAPYNRGQHAFTAGDLAGLDTLYPKAACAA